MQIHSCMLHEGPLTLTELCYELLLSGPLMCSRSPARSQSPAPRAPLIGGSTMTSTNPAFASNLYDSTYSGDSEGARNPVYEAGAGGSTPGQGKSNPLFSSNILDSSESQQVCSSALSCFQWLSALVVGMCSSHLHASHYIRSKTLLSFGPANHSQLIGQ